MTYQPKKALVLAACGFAGIFSATVQAQDPQLQSAASDYQMAAISNRAVGKIVVAGDYDNAIERLEVKGRRSFEASTNLCVAYTMAGDLEHADRACGVALELSEAAMVRRDIAVALTNLGVLDIVRGDASAARDNFTRAVAMNAQLEHASDNLERLSAGAAF